MCLLTFGLPSKVRLGDKVFLDDLREKAWGNLEANSVDSKAIEYYT